MPATPFLSVVIPVYNREREIPRTLESCLSQTDADFEIIVVDDASKDRSADVIAQYDRVRLIRHPTNLGSTRARTTGIRESRGEWIVRLDSDDELLPGALQKAQHYAQAQPPRVGRIGLMYRYADGRTSPYPAPTGASLGYEDFLRWLDNTELYDCLTILRRTALDAAPLPDARFMEILHHLDFSKQFDTVWIPEFGLLYHVDAAGRQSKTWATPPEAREDLEEVRQILERHEEPLARCAPSFYRAQLRRKIVGLALAGDRGAAIREGFRQLKAYPLSPLHWAALGCAALGRRPLSIALDLKWWLVEQRRMRLANPRRKPGDPLAAYKDS